MPDYQFKSGEDWYRVRTDKPVTSPDEFRTLVQDKYRAGEVELIQPSDPGKYLDALVRTVTAAALPIAGGLAGGAVGGPIGIAAGSMAGEAANQQLGVTPPDLMQIGLVGALPMVPAGGRKLLTSLPGAAVGLQENLMRELGEQGSQIVQKMVTKLGPSRPLFQRVEQAGQGLMLDPVNLRAASQTLGAQQAQVVKAWKEAGVEGLLEGAQDLSGAPGTFIQFSKFRQNQTQLGQKMQSIIAREDVGSGQAKKLYGAMWDDVDTLVANTPGPLGDLLGKAVRARKQESAAELLTDFFTKGGSRKGGFQQVDLDQVLTKIDRNKDTLLKLMPPKDYQDVVDTLVDLANVPTIQRGLMSGQSVPFTQRQLMSGLVGGGLGLVAGESVGLNLAAGGASGALGGILLAEAVSAALATAPGRFLIRQLAQRGATYDQIGNALLQSGRAALFGDQPLTPPPQTPTGGAPLQGPEGIR